MQIAMIEGCTRVCGKSQGFLGLPLRDDMVNDSVMGPVNFMTSAWTPDPAELSKLTAGAAIHVRIAGQSPPPMMVAVGEPPEDALQLCFEAADLRVAEVMAANFLSDGLTLADLPELQQGAFRHAATALRLAGLTA